MIKVGSRVNLIKSTTLIMPGKQANVVVSKKNPCSGVIVSMKRKKIATNIVVMCEFRPDVLKDNSVFVFSLKEFEEIKE
ncbi:MAG TPA: hypothetical protein VD757_01675 [Candidatus Nitrosocosmicus sp.]|nr:hypothetical protein [Candidatus Nitrosocosmicus sp.]